MQLINTVEGLLFRIYLTNGHFRLVRNRHQNNSNDFETESFQKAAGCTTPKEMKQKVECALEKTMKTMNWAFTNNVQIIPSTHPQFPPELHQLKDSSPLIFVKGELPQGSMAAVIGTRSPSPLAQYKVELIVQSLVQKQLGIVSGLALGIDTLAHEAALRSGIYTLAVLPRSLDQMYPQENKSLASRIVEAGGGLFSELPPGINAAFNPFVNRNRIQAALSQYIIPVEMGINSGTEYTIQYGAKYKKEIIICLPNKEEMELYLTHHEGLLPAIKKYKPTGHLQVLQNWSQLSTAIGKLQVQSQLF